MRAPWLTQGYLKEEKASERLWQGGWLHTGDVAAQDARRSVRITDRAKDVIKIGGEWVSLARARGHPRCSTRASPRSP